MAVAYFKHLWFRVFKAIDEIYKRHSKAFGRIGVTLDLQLKNAGDQTIPPMKYPSSFHQTCLSAKESDGANASGARAGQKLIFAASV
jgi:hypothetical protein